MCSVENKVSVIMPVYNAERFLRQAVDSVLTQSYSDFELILVDDCSTDGSYDILCEYENKDKRVRVFKNEQNKGVSYTRNFAVSKANGEYIALIDSDDMWRKDKLSKQMSLIEKYPDTDLCYTASAFVDTESVESDFVFNVPEQVTYKKLLKQNVASCSSVLIKKKWLVKYPMAHDNMHEDFAVWLSVLKDGGKARGINEPLLIYRVAANSKSGNKFKSMGMTYRVYKYMGLNIFERCYYMCFYILSGIKKHGSI